MNKNKQSILTPTHFVLMFFLMIAFSGAIAQPVGDGIVTFLDKVGEADFSANILRKTFGDGFVDSIGQPGGVESGNVLAAMFSIFNSALLAVAMFYFGYQAVSSIAATAEDGQFLGQRFSTVWVPIRFTIGVVSLVPMFGGFSGSQVIFMWFTKIGIGMANAMVIAGLTVLGNTPDFFASKATPTDQKAKEISQALFKGHVCVFGATIDDSDIASSLPQQTKDVFGNSRITEIELKGGTNVTTLSPESPYRIIFTSIDSLAQSSFPCGGVVIALPSEKAFEAEAYSQAITDLDKKDIISHREYSKKAFDIGVKNLKILNAEVRKLAKDYVDNLQSKSYAKDVVPELENLADTYSSTVRNEILSQLPSSVKSDQAIKKATENIDKYGWLMLGSFYQTIAVAQGNYSRAVALNTSVIPFGSGTVNFNEFSTKAFDSVAIGEVELQDQTTWDVTEGIGKSIIDWTIQAGLSDSDTGTFNPIIELKQLGDTIITAGVTVIGIIAAARVTAKLTEKLADAADSTLLGKGINLLTGAGKIIEAAASGVNEALSAIMPFIIMMMLALFFFAFMLAVYIPMLPFITWFGGVIGWFSSVIESLVAAPIGAFIHLDAEGQGMGQRTQHTYLFLMNVLLRPALMVFGFFAASLGIMILGKMLFILFIPALAQAQTNSMTGLIMILGYIFVFVSLALTMIHGSFNLIHIIPDQVISWAGGHISTRMGQDTDDRAVAVFNRGSSRMDTAASQRMFDPKKPPGGGGSGGDFDLKKTPGA